MLIQVPISLGELVDKLSILKIKRTKITDTEKRKQIAIETSYLQRQLDQLLTFPAQHFLDRLIEINTKLWEIEDAIREKERNKQFDEQFIELARSVYLTNDQRFAIKNQINTKYGSRIQEVKSYQQY